MQKIKKVIFDDNTELELEGLKPIADFKSTYGYRAQFRDFEDTILDHIDEDRIERYAEWSLDMVKEDDCECDCDHNDTIEDIDDDIVIREAFCRMVGNDFNDIISQDLMKRFVRVLYASDKTKIEEYIKQKEIELKL